MRQQLRFLYSLITPLLNFLVALPLFSQKQHYLSTKSNKNLISLFNRKFNSTEPTTLKEEKSLFRTAKYKDYTIDNESEKDSNHPDPRRDGACPTRGKGTLQMESRIMSCEILGQQRLKNLRGQLRPNV